MTTFEYVAFHSGGDFFGSQFYCIGCNKICPQSRFLCYAGSHQGSEFLFCDLHEDYVREMSAPHCVQVDQAEQLANEAGVTYEEASNALKYYESYRDALQNLLPDC